MQNATYTQAQQNAFVAKLQHTQVHAVDVQHGLMLAYTDTGCAYSMGDDVWEATGEAQQGEVYLREEFVCEYSTDETTLYLHFEDENFTKRYTNDEEGWAHLGTLGSTLLKKKPDFDARNYGYTKLLPLIKRMNHFEIDERETGKNKTKNVYIRIRG